MPGLFFRLRLLHLAVATTGGASRPVVDGTRPRIGGCLSLGQPSIGGWAGVGNRVAIAHNHPFANELRP